MTSRRDSDAAAGPSGVPELKDHIRRTLEQNGALDRLRASVRKEMLEAISARQGLAPVEVPAENVLINELITEYLKFNGYKETLSVMRAETGHGQKVRRRGAGIVIVPLSRHVACEALALHSRLTAAHLTPVSTTPPPQSPPSSQEKLDRGLVARRLNLEPRVQVRGGGTREAPEMPLLYFLVKDACEGN
jgi:hypothetical protein